MIISEKIFYRLAEINMSQSEFSRQTGISTSTINDWKHKKTNPSADKLVCICKVLGMSLKDLLCEEEDKEYFETDYFVNEKQIIELISKLDIIVQRRIVSYLEQLFFKENAKKCNISIIKDVNNHKIVVLNDLRFKGRKNVDWNIVEDCLKDYIGTCKEIIDTNDMIYIGSDFPDEYANSKDTKVLRGANEYAKANASSAIHELIQVASNKSFSENYEKKHNKNAKYGWYRYDTRFAIPKYGNDGELIGYNIYKGRLVIRHSDDGKLYLYDILRIKKETSEPL